MQKISLLPVRSDTKTMASPVGLKTGFSSRAPSCVSWVRPPVERSFTQISSFPLRLDWKIIRFPSGDHFGIVSAPGSVVA